MNQVVLGSEKFLLDPRSKYLYWIETIADRELLGPFSDRAVAEAWGSSQFGRDLSWAIVETRRPSYKQLKAIRIKWTRMDLR